jgi:4-amino-4-deoxy-L-arabinose transferase-like glycosyltransferase
MDRPEPLNESLATGGTARWKPVFFVAALTVILGAGIWLRCQHMTDVLSRSPDERTYTVYAARLADEGFGVYRELFTNYDLNPSSWVYPSPNRFGHVLLFAAMMKITGNRDGRAGAAVSWIFSIFSLLLVAWIGIRFFNPAVGLLAAAFLAFSFGELGMARRAWQDTTFGFCGLLLVYLTCEITAAPRRKILYAAFFVVGTFAFLTKETAFLCFGLCGLWLAVILLFHERSWKLLIGLLLGGLGSLLLAFAVLAALAGRASLVLASVDHVTHSPGWEWLKTYCSGPWYQFFYLLWIVGPLTAVMAAVGAVVAMFGRAPQIRRFSGLRDVRAAGMTVIMTLGFIGLAAFVPNLQYLRIISPSDGTYCLLAAIGLWYLVALARHALPGFPRHGITGLAILAVVLAGLRDYDAFTKVVAASGMEELAVSGIRLTMGR